MKSQVPAASKNIAQFTFIRWLVLGQMLPVLMWLDASNTSRTIIAMTYILTFPLLLAWLATRYRDAYIYAQKTGSPRPKNILALICLISIVLTFGCAAIFRFWLGWHLSPAGEYAIKFMAWLITVTGLEAFYCAFVDACHQMRK